MERKVVTMNDIAKELKISVNTISRALKDAPDISVKTKVLVLNKAEEMGYVPNALASSLRSGKTNIIAIVFDNMVNPYFMIMANDIHIKATELGFDTMIYTPSSKVFTDDSLKMILSRHVDAIITFLEPTKEAIKICSNLMIPLILVGRRTTDNLIDTVSCDDVLGGYKACSMLFDSGAKNLCYLGIPKDIECSKSRYDGFLKRIMESELEYLEEPYIVIDDESSISNNIDLIIEKNIDGIFCFNDVIAIRVMNYLESKGINAPKDIKVVGYDNIQSQLPIVSNLTSIYVRKEEIVEEVFKILIEKNNNYCSTVKQVVLETNVYYGKTC